MCCRWGIVANGAASARGALADDSGGARWNHLVSLRDHIAMSHGRVAGVSAGIASTLACHLAYPIAGVTNHRLFLLSFHLDYVGWVAGEQAHARDMLVENR